ncbi:GspH/FimT family pseudopilin [Candidatus Kuenenia sp.]|uniref:GspH/FimT family pseudopilin n=1 Tax=Candidatus Kuenenia sp. TaxID=2499824 RepID=UPI00321FDF34
MGSCTAVKTLFGIWDLFVIFLLIEGGIGSIKRLVQVTNLNPLEVIIMQNQKGFSLIELIVVMAIMGIAAGIAVPVYNNMKPQIRLNGAARQVMGDLMWARMRAISENNNYVIAFGEAGPTLTNDTYYIYDDNDNDFSSVGIEADELVKEVVIPDKYKDMGYGYASGIKKTDNTNTLTGDAVTFNSGGASKPIWFNFKPNGSPNITGTIYLIPDEDEASGRKDRSRALSVNQTGRIKSWRYNMASNLWE